MNTSTSTRVWSPFQEAIFRNVAEGRGHLVVQARAGSGKTSTIVESFEHVPRGLTVLMVAFNKSIADELASRAPKGIRVSTLHSFGLMACRMAFGKVQIDKYKMWGILDSLLENSMVFGMPIGTQADPEQVRKNRLVHRAAVKIVSLAKGCLASTVTEFENIANDFDIDLSEIEEDRRPAFFRVIQAALDEAKSDTANIDFDDMIWLPVVLGLRVQKYDIVFVDETQDLNKAQQELSLAACKRGGRIVAVGDDRQSIYQFRGADSEAMPTLINRLNAKVMPLSVTYRCAKAIVDKANTYVPDLQAAEGAAEGLVEAASYEDMNKRVQPGDFVLSRANAPLVALCMRMLKEGRRVTIAGRDIGASLTALVEKSKARTVPELSAWIGKWAEGECARLTAMKPPRETDAINDKAQCLYAFCEGLTTAAEVTARIEASFSDEDDRRRVVLSSTHKAKGLERDRVWMLSWTYRPERGIEEENLYYVAVTRARRELFLVSKPVKTAAEM